MNGILKWDSIEWNKTNCACDGKYLDYRISHECVNYIINIVF